MNNSIQKFEEGEFESPEKTNQGGIPNGNGDGIKREENNNGLGEINPSTEAAEPTAGGSKCASASSPEERKAAIKKAHDLLVSIGIGTGAPCEECDDDYAPRPPITSDTYDAPDSPVKTKGGKSKVTHPNEHPKPVNKCGEGCDGAVEEETEDPKEDDSVVKGEEHIPTWAELKKTSIATPALRDALTNGSSRTAAEMQLHDKERELGEDLLNMQEGGKEFADRQFDSMDPQQYQQAHDETVENINTNPNAHPEVVYDNAKFKAYMDASSPVEDMNDTEQVENSVHASKVDSLMDRVRALIRYQQAMTGPNKSLIARDEADRQMLSKLNGELYKSTEDHIPTWAEVRKSIANKESAKALEYNQYENVGELSNYRAGEALPGAIQTQANEMRRIVDEQSDEMNGSRKAAKENPVLAPANTVTDDIAYNVDEVHPQNEPANTRRYPWDNLSDASLKNALIDLIRQNVRLQQRLVEPMSTNIAQAHYEEKAYPMRVAMANSKHTNKGEEHIPTWAEVRKAYQATLTPAPAVQTRLDATTKDAGYDLGPVGSAFELNAPENDDIRDAKAQIATRERTLAAQPDSPTAQKFYNDTIGKLRETLANAKATRANTLNAMAADPEKLAEAKARNKAVAGELDTLDGQ